MIFLDLFADPYNVVSLGDDCVQINLLIPKLHHIPGGWNSQYSHTLKP